MFNPFYSRSPGSNLSPRGSGCYWLLGGACSLPIQMRDDGAQRRILDRSLHNYIQFVLCGERKVKGAVGPIPLRERTALDVDGISLCRIVDRVGAPVGDYLSDWLPWTGICLWTVSRHHLPRNISIAGKDGLPFYAITLWVVLFAALGLVIHRVQEPSAYD
jgi:hypothetical protein